MRQAVAYVAIVAGLAAAVVLGAERKTLDIYFIDVEGGQSTLVVTPAGQTLLIDAGWAGVPSGGRMQGTPGDPRVARDANRIFERLRQVQGLEDVWQLHRSVRPGVENFADQQIANLDESTAHWIKLAANDDGSFRLMNGRTGAWKSYAVDNLGR